MKNTDLTKVFSIIMAAAIVTSLGTITPVETILGNDAGNTQIISSTQTNLEDIMLVSNVLK